MKFPRRRFFHLAAGAVAIPVVSRVRETWAQNYPLKPVRLILGFPPGGASDTVMRIMAQWLSERLGKPALVENKPGAATNLAVEALVNSPADGHTLGLIASSTTVNATLYGSLSFNILRDISPVASFVRFPHVMVVNPSMPARTVAELIAFAKNNPGKISIASYGTGTVSHLAAELFKSMVGINLVHVPYRGSGPAEIDLMAGRVEVMIDTLTSALPHIRSGAVRALAMTGNTRSDTLPDVPTIGDTVPGYDVESWMGLGAPKGTPPEIVERLNREINAALTNPSVKSRLTDLAAAPMILTAPEFAKLIARDTEKWASIIKTYNVKPD